MRRSDRAISPEEAMKILESAEYMLLSTCGDDRQPYGVPLNFCMIRGAIYLHCALEGHKIHNLEQNPKVSGCVVGKTQPLPEKFGTLYESVIARGMAVEVFEGEKIDALKVCET